MKLATVVIAKTVEQYVGNKRQELTQLGLETLEVESQLSEAEFIQLSNDFPSYAPGDKVSLHETELSFVKDAQPDTLKNTNGFKFVKSRFSNVALVGIPDGKFQTEDPYVSPERYNAQLALIPISNVALTLPAKAQFVTVLNLSGYALSAQCGETQQTFKLGFHVDGSNDPNWIEQAILRRKHWKFGHKNEDVIEPPPYRPAYWYRTFDEEVAKQITGAKEKYANRDGSFQFGFMTPEEKDRAEELERETIERRREEVLSK